MQTFIALEKVVINRGFDLENGRIVGIKSNSTGNTYFVELLRKDFGQHVFGSRIIRITPTDIAMNVVTIEKHKI